MGNKTPSSASCENLVVEIYLPDEQDFTKIQLNLKAQAIDLRSPIHFLHLGLPHAIDTMVKDHFYECCIIPPLFTPAYASEDFLSQPLFY